jgi:hypothetical protein
MSIQVGNYHAEGPFGNAGSLASRSGVYVILGRASPAVPWTVVDVGESSDICARVGCHDRAPDWGRQGHAQMAVAAIYCDEPTRMRVERELRQQFRPACGVI